MNTQRKTNRTVLYLMLIVIFGPLAFAYVLVQKGHAYEFKVNHHGDLITPVVQIAPKHPLGKAVKGKWWLATVSPSECETTFYTMRQIRTALGKRASRVERLYIHPTQSQHCQSVANENYSDMKQVPLAVTDINALFPYTTGYYLIDPKGNIVMHYDTDTEPKGMLSDIKRLLKLSKIG